MIGKKQMERELRCLRLAMMQYGLLIDLIEKRAKQLIKKEIEDEKLERQLKGRK